MELIKHNKTLSLILITLITHFPLTLFSQETPTKEYFKDHSAVYVTTKNQVTFENNNMQAEIVVEGLSYTNLKLTYGSSRSGVGIPLSNYDFKGLIDNTTLNATVKVKVRMPTGELTFSENFQRLANIQLSSSF